LREAPRPVDFTDARDKEPIRCDSAHVEALARS